MQNLKLEEVYSLLESIKTKLPNNLEIELFRSSLMTLREDQKIIKGDLEFLKQKLIDPENGLIVKVNKNTESISEINLEIANHEHTHKKLDSFYIKVDSMDRWRGAVNKALWIVYTAVIGVIVAIIFSSDKI